MELRNASCLESADLLTPLLIRRLSRELRKKLADAPDIPGYVVERVAAWVDSNVPQSVRNDPSLDPLELLYHCCDMLKRHSPTDLAAVLGLGGSEASEPTLAQMLLDLRQIDVPSGAIYQQVRSAVATSKHHMNTACS
jgi:hypothetical protein